ncbi:rod-binding protein [Ferrovibrio sp.]|uniref:rod-binding protein n=1 Tax=Ferrovibrio sp. TaxID=1917215 RepID=UPI0025BF6F7B|nr:rod-binding protein [Ferrovibrio sp.]MBX3455895.1 rod-binding protein [Ferrovibrio sp.]
MDMQIASSANAVYAQQQALAARSKVDGFAANGMSTASQAQMRKTAEDFESHFLSQMFEMMSAGVKTDGPFGGGNAEATWRSFLNQEYGKEMSRNRGIGIANMVYDQMIKIQEAAQ